MFVFLSNLSLDLYYAKLYCLKLTRRKRDNNLLKQGLKKNQTRVNLKEGTLILVFVIERKLLSEPVTA